MTLILCFDSVNSLSKKIFGRQQVLSYRLGQSKILSNLKINVKTSLSI